METQNDQMATWWMHLTLHHNRLLQFKKANTLALISVGTYPNIYIMPNIEWIMFLCGKYKIVQSKKWCLMGLRIALKIESSQRTGTAYILQNLKGLLIPSCSWFHHPTFSGVKTSQVLQFPTGPRHRSPLHVGGARRKQVRSSRHVL